MKKITNQRAAKIARNINAMNMQYEYTDNHKKYKFWRSLKNKLETILESLTDEDKNIVASLCEVDKLEYFNLKEIKTSEINNMKTMKNQNKSFRSKVFKQAWQIARSTGKSFKISLLKAWQVYKLRKRMTKEIVKFAFEKVDGSLRYAYGTLQQTAKFIKGTGKENFKSVPYFDTEANGFRSFKVDSLIKIY